MELSDTVVLRPGGMMVRTREGDAPMDPREFLRRWRNGLLVEGGATMGDYFDVLRALPPAHLDVVDAITFSNVRPYLREAQLPRDGKSRGLVGVCVSHYALVDGVSKQGLESGEAMVNCKLDVAGFDSELIGYSLSLPAYDLVDLPIYLARSGEMLADALPTGRFTFSADLGEFTRTVLDEVCFHGSPEDRDGMMERLDDLWERAQEDMAEGRLKEWKPRGSEGG